MRSERTEFPGADGQRLAARVDAPDAHIRAHALFAHCFTGPTCEQLAGRMPQHGDSTSGDRHAQDPLVAPTVRGWLLDGTLAEHVPA